MARLPDRAAEDGVKVTKHELEQEAARVLGEGAATIRETQQLATWTCTLRFVFLSKTRCAMSGEGKSRMAARRHLLEFLRQLNPIHEVATREGPSAVAASAWAARRSAQHGPS